MARVWHPTNVHAMMITSRSRADVHPVVIMGALMVTAQNREYASAMRVTFIRQITAPVYRSVRIAKMVSVKNQVNVSANRVTNGMCMNLNVVLYARNLVYMVIVLHPISARVTMVISTQV